MWRSMRYAILKRERLGITRCYKVHGHNDARSTRGSQIAAEADLYYSVKCIKHL